MTARPHLAVVVLVVAVVAAVVLADTGARHQADTPDPVRSPAKPDVVLVTVTAAPTVTPTATVTATRTVNARAARSSDRPSLPDRDGPTAAQWAALRECESSGNYRAVSSTGRYRGAYQFDHQTWASVGGSGDPAAASRAEQDRRAQALYDARGSQPWPVCGKHL